MYWVHCPIFRAPVIRIEIAHLFMLDWPENIRRRGEGKHHSLQDLALELGLTLRPVQA